MKVKYSYSLAAVLLLMLFSAAAAEKKDCLALDSLSDPKRWGPAESTVSSASVAGKKALQWNVPVDHFGGEKNYPIGWPRNYFTSFWRKPAVPANWRDWDCIEFDLKMKLENDPQNQLAPVTFSVRMGSQRFGKTFNKLHDGKVHHITVRLSELADPARITMLGFSISERGYKHGAKLTLQAWNFRLTRSADCSVKKMKVLTPAITATDPSVKLQLLVTGPAGKVAQGVPFELTRLADGKVLRREQLPVQRGDRELDIEISELDLKPGNYKLTIFPGQKGKSQSGSFKVLSSPYKVKK